MALNASTNMHRHADFAHRGGMEWGARKQMGKNLKLAWAKFSTLGCFCYEYNSMAYASTPTPKVENSAQVLSC